MPPLETERRVPFHDPAEQVQLVETGHDDDALGVRLETRHEIALEPFPAFLLYERTLGILPSGERVLDQSQVRTLTSHRDTNTNRTIAAAAAQSPVRH